MIERQLRMEEYVADIEKRLATLERRMTLASEFLAQAGHAIPYPDRLGEHIRSAAYALHPEVPRE